MMAPQNPLPPPYEEAGRELWATNVPRRVRRETGGRRNDWLRSAGGGPAVPGG